MFERFASVFAQVIEPLAEGRLFCLGYSRACLDALSSLGHRAKPLVVRGVVLGKLESTELYEHPAARESLATTALGSPHANGRLAFGLAGATPDASIQVPYRTIGMPHSADPGNSTLGNYDESGKWLGHLVVIVDRTLIDMTIGQLNSPHFGIDLTPPYITVATDDDFLSGANKLYVIHNGCLICYQAYPAERTHEASRSWTDPDERAKLKLVGRQAASRFAGQPDSQLHMPN